MSKYVLPLAIFTALEASVKAHGDKIGKGTLFRGDAPCCIHGHAAVVDGLTPTQAYDAVYLDPDEEVTTPLPPTPTMDALNDAGISYSVNDRRLVNRVSVTFDEWCKLLDVSAAPAPEVAHV